MKCVILAGGFGTRLSEETDRIPKPLVEIGGRPILWHIMKHYSHHGISEFVICLGYKGYTIKNYFKDYLLHLSDVTLDLATGEMKVHQNFAESWRVSLIDTGLDSQTGGRLRRVRQYLGNETFCLTYGDGVSDVDITESIRFHKEHGKLVTVTAVTPPGRFGMLRIEGDIVEQFAEKADNTGSYINGGFFVVEPRALDYIPSDDTPWELEPLERLAAEGHLAAYRHTGFWRAMDTLRDKRQLDALWDSGTPPWKVW